ncbi:MAG TPA: hypothetical protein VGP13_03105 [Candidatus Paceibacterota bacterium]|jgi:hypothetical protein|nr:hypothetical protein [Candidatus Paceibacterota bacterium]
MALRPERFKLWHSVAGLVVLLIIEALFLALWPASFVVLVPLFAIAGTAVTLYVATEIVEEVSGKPKLFALLTAIIAEFVIFFAFQYHLLGHFDHLAFATLGSDAVSLLLQSTMVFALNPIDLPTDTAGRLLLLVDTLGSLGLVLFVLQNIWQLRK